VKKSDKHRQTMWLKTFRDRRDAPPGGWVRYLRDGWSHDPNDWAARYRLYTLSNAWRQRRQGAITRADATCELCQQKAARLEVHHVTYCRAGREQVEDLRVLCRPCHRMVHSSYQRPSLPLNEATAARLRRRRTERELRDDRKTSRDMTMAAMAIAVRDRVRQEAAVRRIRRRPQGVKLPDPIA
jgi:hypothetical protein